MLPRKGICQTCESEQNCPMPAMLTRHRANIKQYGANYEMVRPDLWSEDAVGEPKVKGDAVTWCPLYYPYIDDSPDEIDLAEWDQEDNPEPVYPVSRHNRRQKTDRG